MTRSAPTENGVEVCWLPGAKGEDVLEQGEGSSRPARRYGLAEEQLKVCEQA
jgi:hypothetical protein